MTRCVSLEKTLGAERRTDMTECDFIVIEQSAATRTKLSKCGYSSLSVWWVDPGRLQGKLLPTRNPSSMTLFKDVVGVDEETGNKGLFKIGAGNDDRIDVSVCVNAHVDVKGQSTNATNAAFVKAFIYFIQNFNLEFCQILTGRLISISISIDFYR